MKKNLPIVSLALICAAFILTGTAHAQSSLTPMSDTDLAEITGQAGFAMMGNFTGFQHDAASRILTGDVSNIHRADDGSSLSFDIKNPGIAMRQIRSRLHMGPQPGVGDSLGTLFIDQVEITTHGTVRITVR